jgi:hypothetical protein
MEASQEEMMAEMKVIQRKMDANRQERKAHREEMRAEMDAWLGGVTHAYLEEEPAPEKTETVEEPQDVPIGAMDEEAIRATEDRAGELRLVLRRHRERNKRAQVNGGSARGRFTRRAVPAMRKGHVRRGPGKRCHRNGIRRPGRTSGTRIVERDRPPAVGYRSPLKRRTKVTVVQETPKERTCEKKRRTRPECNSGIRKLKKVSRTGKRGRIVKRDQRREAKRTHLEVTRKILDLEIAMLIVGSYIGLREPGDGTLWKCRPPPKRKR